MKTESHIWERTGNIAIEFRSRGKASGIATTEAGLWLHKLVDEENRTVAFIGIPVHRLRALCRRAKRRGRVDRAAGDDKAQCVALLRITEIFQTDIPGDG